MLMIVFILACIGLTNILVYGHIFDKIRPNKRFFKCPMCVGFWVGIALYLVFVWNTWFIVESYYILLETFVFGTISSLVSYITLSMIDDEGVKIKHE